MQINKTNNVVFIKDLESNIIQEAFVVLKENINFEIETNTKSLSKEKTNVNILKEAEFFINQEIQKNNFKYDKYKISKLERKIRNLKIVNLISIIIFISYLIIK